MMQLKGNYTREKHTFIGNIYVYVYMHTVKLGHHESREKNTLSEAIILLHQIIIRVLETIATVVSS